MKTIEIILFCITFYFTVIRFISMTKLFSYKLNNLFEAFTEKENQYTVIVNWSMWFYQIYFWGNYFLIFK